MSAARPAPLTGWIVFDGIDPRHEHVGSPLAVEFNRITGTWRELRPGDSHDSVVIWMQLGCTCGWRSQRFTTPLGAEWLAGELVMSTLDQEALACVWRLEHRDQIGRLPHLVRETRSRHLFECHSDGPRSVPEMQKVS